MAAVRFRDRADAGRQLAVAVTDRINDGVVVLGLPRGGVPVAARVAESLHAPLDIIVVRKLGVPFHPELAMGAIGESGARFVDAEVVRLAGVDADQFAAVERVERVELERRVQEYRGGRPPVPLRGATALIVDDGIATGSTAAVACDAARALGAERVVVAAPVASRQAVQQLSHRADEVICLQIPESFHAVGQWYGEFDATPDSEVIVALSASARRLEGPAVRSPIDAEVLIPDGALSVRGHLVVPERAAGLVVFAHGSGSSRHSPRNASVARELNHAGFATLLMDLLTLDEERDRANVFDVELLAGRLLAATRWASVQRFVGDLPIGYFGASTGAAAALWAAAAPDADRSGKEVLAVVSRGGRPDLARSRLSEVRAPTLMIVGELDVEVLQLNRLAAGELRVEHRIGIVAGASHVFAEPGTLEAAAGLARDWFVEHVTHAGAASERMVP